MAFFAKIAASFMTVLSLILPFLGKARMWRGFGVGLLWTLRVGLVGLILVVLAVVQRIFLPNFIDAPWAALREYLWLPVFAILFYLLIVFAWWLYKLLISPDEGSYFPDIDEAWDEASDALNRSGIDLTQVPLFLVFGRSGSKEEAVFSATQTPYNVKMTPPRFDAPLHVWANRDAIYVTCPGASLLGKHASVLAGETNGAANVGADLGAADAVDDDPNRTVKATGKVLEVQAVLAAAHREGRGPNQLNPEEKREIEVLMGQEQAEHARKLSLQKASLLKNPAALNELSARLRHLCRLIVRDRRPFCAVNGVMVLLPLAATESEDDANQTGELVALDLKAARQVLQVYCPEFVLVCDMDSLPGFQDFIGRFQPNERGRRVGQRFPLNPALEPAQLEEELAAVVARIGRQLIPSWVYKLFKVESSARDTVPVVLRDNVRLYRLMSTIRQRQKRLSKILTRGFLIEEGAPLLFGGCYVAGTGSEASSQAFVAGVFQRLTQEQNHVAWTPDALSEESNLRRFTIIGYGITAALGAVLVGLAYFIVKHLLSK